MALNWLDPNAKNDAETGVRTISADVEKALYEDIVSGRLEPGKKLKPEALRDRYEVGISPIREALLRLSSDGLVEHLGQRGFRVPPASELELSDITELRCHLSCLALRGSIERGDFAWEGALVAAFHQVERVTGLVASDPVTYLGQWEYLNRQFHHALESACGSPWLLRFTRIVYGQSERYRRHFVSYTALMPESQDEHREILNAALARDAATACKLLEDHIRKGVGIVKEGMRAKAPVISVGKTKSSKAHKEAS